MVYLFNNISASFKTEIWFIHHHHLIILSYHQHRYPWPSLATPLYRSSLSVGPDSYTLYLHRAAVCRFKLVTLLLLGHVKGSIGVHHISLSLLLQQCPACLVHLTWIVFVMGGRWPYSGCFVGCCLQDLFNIACNILV